MFEKEAEKYVNNLKNEWQKMGEKLENWNEPCFKVARLSFIDGAQFGYNKASEWHLVKDGDLPKDENYVLVSNGKDWTKGFYKDKKWNIISLVGFTKIIAWKEIVLPKEIEK